MNNLAASLREWLNVNGYRLSDDDVIAAAEYIEMSGPEYTIFDWFRDTKQNYPQFLEIGSEVFE